MDINFSLVEILASLGGGSFITYLLTLKYQKAKAREEAKQEELESDKSIINNAQSAADKQIENAQKLIDMYKAGIDDITKMYNEKMVKNREKIDTLEKQLAELKKTSDEKELRIEQLTDLVNDLKLEVESLRKISEHNCDLCEFKAGCKKYEALRKQLKNKITSKNKIK